MSKHHNILIYVGIDFLTN